MRKAIQMLAVVGCLAAVGSIGGSLRAEPPGKVYVPDVAGDVSERFGAVLASEISAALMKHGIKAFTYGNLKDQLKQEEHKEVLECDEDDKCVDELVAGFGLASRIFGVVTDLGDKEFHIELSLATKGEFQKKVTQSVTCEKRELKTVVSRMSMKLLGVDDSIPSQRPDPGRDDDEEDDGEEWDPGVAKRVVVTFSSRPAGAVVLVDGKLACRDTARKCTKELRAGAHEVSMQKEEFQPRKEMLVLNTTQVVSWKLVPDFGLLTVKSTPPGLLVRIGNEVAGRTPLAAHRLKPGPYVVAVDDPCFRRKKKSVDIVREQTVNLALSPKPRQGAIDVSARDGEGNALAPDVYVDGSFIGSAPDVFKVSVCAREVSVRMDGFTDWSSQLSVGERQVKRLEAVLERPQPEVPVVEPEAELVPAREWESVCEHFVACCRAFNDAAAGLSGFPDVGETDEDQCVEPDGMGLMPSAMREASCGQMLEALRQSCAGYQLVPGFVCPVECE